MGYIYASSGYADDVQEAVDMAIVGDYVVLPEGIWVWNGELVTIPDGGVNLIGASLAGCMGHEDGWAHYTPTTILRNNVQAQMINCGRETHGNGQLNPVRISGIQLEGFPPANVAEEQSGVNALYLRQIPNFRIDYCTFVNWGSAPVHITCNDGVYGANVSSYGVIDHNVITNPYKLTPPPDGNWYWGYGIGMSGTARLSDPDIMDEWDEQAQNWFGYYGFKKGGIVVYIEDNHINLPRHHISSLDFAFYTARYNLLDEPACGYQAAAIDVHGPAYPSGRGCVAYNNKIVGAVNNQKPWGGTYYSAAVGLRGGSSLIYNNEFICNLYNQYNYFLLLSKGDYVEGLEYQQIDQTYVWNNSYTGCTHITKPPEIIQDVHYFLRAPNQAQDGFTYTPYPYPHPLTVEGIHSLSVHSNPSNIPFTIRRI